MKEFTRRLFVQTLEERRLLAGDVLFDEIQDQPPAEIALANDRGGSSREAEGESVLRVRLDFRFDQSDFFTKRFPQARAAMQQVVDDVVARFNDTLDAVNPPTRPEVTWTPSSINPLTGVREALPQNFRVAANELVVFVRGNNLPGSTRGLGGFNTIRAGFSCSGTGAAACIADGNAFLANLRTRGETGATADPATDFAPVVSSITIDTRDDIPWNFGPVGTGDPGETDFRALVAHEFAHAIGFGTSPSYMRYVSGSTFTGPRANAVFPGSANIPLEGVNHLASSVLDVVPTTLTERYEGLLSELDFAILDDLGWDLIADTRPTVQLTNAAPIVAESAGTVTLTANLSAAGNQTLTVPVVISGPASADSDYVVSPNSFTFPAGQRSATMTVNIVDNMVDEAIESLTVRLQDSASAKLGSSTETTITILDDDDTSAAQVNLRPAEFTSTPLQIPGDGDPTAILFRATANSMMRVTRLGGTAVNEAFFVLNDALEPIGSYEGASILAVPVVAGQLYGLVFQGRTTAEQYRVESSAGFAAIANRSPTNLLQPADVSGDGEVSSLDALRVINQLNASGGTALDANDPSLEPDNYFDVSGDGTISALDALRVINALTPVDGAASEPLLAPQMATFNATAAGSSGLRTDSAETWGMSSRDAGVDPIHASMVLNLEPACSSQRVFHTMAGVANVDESESTLALDTGSVDAVLTTFSASLSGPDSVAIARR